MWCCLQCREIFALFPGELPYNVPWEANYNIQESLKANSWMARCFIQHGRLVFPIDRLDTRFSLCSQQILYSFHCLWGQVYGGHPQFCCDLLISLAVFTILLTHYFCYTKLSFRLFAELLVLSAAAWSPGHVLLLFSPRSKCHLCRSHDSLCHQTLVVFSCEIPQGLITTHVLFCKNSISPRDCRMCSNVALFF